MKTNTVNKLNYTFFSGEITLIDLTRCLLFHKRIIILSTLLFSILGIVYAFTAKEIFTTNTIFITKTASTSNTNLSNLASLAGINLGTSSGNVDPSDYLDKVILDNDFLSKILNKKWFFKGDSIYLDEILKLKKDSSFIDWKYRYEKLKLDYVREKNLLSVIKDKKTGILNLTINMPDPQLSFDVNRFIINLLSDYIRNAIQSQAKEKRLFIEARINEVKKDLQKSEDTLVFFKERNVLSSSPKIMIEEMRLTRNITLNQEIFIQYQKQYEIARLEELNDQTLIQIVKNPEIPIKKSKPKRAQIAVLATFLGLSVGILIVIILSFYSFICNFKIKEN